MTNGGRDLGGTRVLVVEDDRDTRELIEIVLREHAAEVTVADSVAAALDAVRTAWPDVLVCDLGLPDGDGYDLLHRVRDMERESGRGRLAAVALTGFVTEEARRRALSEGYQTHVAKPIDPYDLVGVIAKALEQAALSPN